MHFLRPCDTESGFSAAVSFFTFCVQVFFLFFSPLQALGALTALVPLLSLSAPFELA